MSRIVVVLAVLLALLVPVPGQAVYHFANIDEIMSGLSGDPNAQYVEIRMLSVGQGDVAQPPDGVQLQREHAHHPARGAEQRVPRKHEWPLDDGHGELGSRHRRHPGLHLHRVSRLRQRVRHDLLGRTG